MTLRRAILRAHLSGDRERRNGLMREAVRRGVTVRELALIVSASTSTVHGWIGARETIIGDPLGEHLETLGLAA